MVKIGSARIDENGNISGGKAGDQTGQEVAREPWYKHKLGWLVYRPKSPEVAEAIARDMEYACDNDMVGYDQSNDQSLYAAAKPYTFDISKVKVPCETDCAKLVRVCILYSGVTIDDFYTGNAPAALDKTGAFIRLDGPDYTEKSSYLKRGDIMVTPEKGHMAVVLNDGSKIGGVRIVTTACVNIRRSPKIGEKVIADAFIGKTYPYNDCYAIDPRGVIWYEVILPDDGRGWISSTYAKKEVY